MRKKFVMILALTSIFSSVTPVFAKTDKEILFRDIPWGTNFNDTCTFIPEADLYGSTMEGLSAETVENVLNGLKYGDDNDYDGAICFCASPFVSPNIDVAGYPIYSMNLYYTYSVENGISFDEGNTVMYGAQYEFEEPQDLDLMYSDLSSKLSEIYGEPSDTSNYTSPFGTKEQYTSWYGANDTSVALKSYDYGDETSVYISYAWLKGDELLEEADNALSDNKKDEESQIYGNGSTNGL